MLDLVADSLVDLASATSGSVRHLRFAGHGRVAEVDVLGTSSLTLDVRLWPDEPATIEVRTADASGRVETRPVSRGRVADVPPGLTSLLLRSAADPGRTLGKTAWVHL